MFQQSYYCISNYWRVIPNIKTTMEFASPLPLQTFGFEQQPKRPNHPFIFEAILRYPEHTSATPNTKKKLTHIDTQIYEKTPSVSENSYSVLRYAISVPRSWHLDMLYATRPSWLHLSRWRSMELPGDP